MFLIFYCFFALWSVQESEAECPTIIGRKEWDAVKPRHYRFLSIPVDLVVIQHTVTQSCSHDKSCAEVVRDLQKTHIEQSFLWDIGPSFLVGSTGKLYEGRGWHHVAVHTPGYNNQSIGIAFIGNFNNEDPSLQALNSVQALIQCGVDEERLTANHKVVVHKQLLSTESPGKKLATKIMSWPDWANDVSEIKKRVEADKQEYQATEMQPRIGKDLALTSSKQIDLLSNLRDVIAELIQNMSNLARGTVDTIEALASGMNKEASLFIEKVVSQLKKLRDQVGAAFGAVSGVPGVQKCSNSLKEQANSLYDDTESKIKNCVNERVQEIDNMINNLGTLSSDAIEYTNTAVESTKNCTELNYGIEPNTKACLNSVTQQTKTASKTYESQRNTALQSIKSNLAALPASLDLCSRQHLLTAGKESTKIVSDISKCPTKTILPSFGGFGR